MGCDGGKGIEVIDQNYNIKQTTSKKDTEKLIKKKKRKIKV